MNFSAISDQTSLGRLFRLPLRLIPPDARLPILQGPLRGQRWIAGSSVHGCWLGSYEYAKQSTFAAAVQPGDTVYDLGANVGLYTLLASKFAGPRGRVISFEPMARNLDLLRRHLALNAVGNCTVIDAAVGRSDGTASFAAGETFSTGRLADESPRTVPVRLVSLDSLVAAGAIPPPQVIKCDIEGAEYDALVGAKNTLVTHQPTLFLATHTPLLRRQCHAFLSTLGYRLQPLYDGPPEEADEFLALSPRRPA